MLQFDQQTANTRISDLLLAAGATLFKTTKYVYALSARDFYHCDVKDLFKVVLNNVRSAERLASFGLSIDDGSCEVLNSDKYNQVFPLIVYSFAVRLPLMLKEFDLSEQQLRSIYLFVLEKGVSNIDDAVAESFSDIRGYVKKGRAVPPYSAEWFRAYLYGGWPELSDISNRNFFFFGAVEVLFVLFYLCLEKEVADVFAEVSGVQRSAQTAPPVLTF